MNTYGIQSRFLAYLCAIESWVLPQNKHVDGLFLLTNATQCTTQWIRRAKGKGHVVLISLSSETTSDKRFPNSVLVFGS